MIIVVDAYNVLKKGIHAQHYISHQQREQFCSDISVYAKRKKHTILVVFDGGDSQWPSVTKRDYISIVYSGQKMNADDYIKEYLDKNKDKEILLVSSDRALCYWADEREMPSLDSELFYAILKKPDAIAAQTGIKQGGLVKMSESEDALVNELMQQAAQAIEYKMEDILPEERTEQKSAVAKKERKLQQIIKKL